MIPKPDSPERATGLHLPAFGPGTGTGLVLAGGVFGLFAGFLQAVTVTVASITLPVGLVVVLAALVAFVRALVHAYGVRLPAFCFFAGWAVVSVLLAIPLPGGDVVIGADAIQKVYLFGGAIIASAAANLPPRLRPAEPPPQSIAEPVP